MPALSILQCTAAAADGSCSRPATAAGRLLTPSYASTHLDQACSSSSSSSSGSRLAHCPRPGTAGSCHSYAGHKAQQHRTAAAPVGALRPGSAAAAKILRAMDKACVATPRGSKAAAAQGRPGQPDDHCSSSSMLGLPEQQQLEPSRLLPSSLDDEQAAHPSSSSSVQLQHAAVGSAGATDSSRPSTAAVQSVLATAAVQGDGVEARLAAIRQKNSSFDHSADLDIVYELDESAVPQAEEGSKAEDVCSVSGVGSKLAAAAACSAAGGDSASIACGSVAAGQQASAMVLNLDELAECTPEVLMIELESLDVEQLVELQHLLG